MATGTPSVIGDYPLTLEMDKEKQKGVSLVAWNGHHGLRQPGRGITQARTRFTPHLCIDKMLLDELTHSVLLGHPVSHPTRRRSRAPLPSFPISKPARLFPSPSRPHEYLTWVGSRLGNFGIRSSESCVRRFSVFAGSIWRNSLIDIHQICHQLMKA